MRAKAPRTETLAQAGLLLGVGSVAASASWSHVVSLANRHGQPGWLALADAAVLETLAVSMGLEIRRRRRRHEPLTFAAAVLVTAVALQLAAQVAQAPRSFWGWTMAALPAIGFLVLAKTSISRTDDIGPASPADAPAEARTAVTTNPTAIAPAPAPMPMPMPDDDLRVAASAVAGDLAEQETPLTRVALTAGLRARGHRISTDRATALLAAVRDELSPETTYVPAASTAAVVTQP